MKNLFLFIVIHDVMAKCVTATTFDHPLDDTLGIQNEKKFNLGKQNTPETQFSEPQFSEILDLVNIYCTIFHF